MRHLRAHAVQVALARPAHHHDLADVDAARQLRHPGAGPAAARPALVHRQRRRDLPEPQPGLRRAARRTSWSSAPTTSTAWTRGRWCEQHIDGGAGVTVAGIRVPRARGLRQFGVIETGRRRPHDRAVPGEARRPARRSRATPTTSYASMGNYVFTTEVLVEALRVDAGDERLGARHGRQHHPDADRRRATAQVYDFDDNDVPGATDRDRGYWRDVGTLDAYHDAHMDLVSVHPIFNLYNRQLADPVQPAAAAAGEVRRGRQRATSRWSAPARSSPARTCATPCCRDNVDGPRGRATSRARCSCRA